MRRVAQWAVLASLLGAPQALAQGQPVAVFYEGNAGPYPLRVRIDPPDVIPGLARIEVQSSDRDITRLRLLALPIDKEHRAYPPVPDVADRIAAAGTSAFAGRLWLMRSGSWEVRLLVDGARGSGEFAIPVAALPTHVASMPVPLGLILLALLLVLAFGMVSIAAAAVREGQLAAKQLVDLKDRKRSRIAAWGTAGVVLVVVILGGLWWSASDRAYAQSIYRSLSLDAELDPTGEKLALRLSDPSWLPSRKLDDLVDWQGLQQGHQVELWVVELPSFEHVWHLHPSRTGTGQFEQMLPAMKAARYALFATVVHADGLTETARSQVTLPAIAGAANGAPLGPDDAAGQGSPLGTAEAAVAALPNGGRLRFEAAGPPAVGQPTSLRFHVEDRHEGEPATDLEPMEGRRVGAILVSGDGETFEALSSRGTVAPASWAIANPEAVQGAELASADFGLDCEFSQAGRYRLFVELRRGGLPEIALLDFRAFQVP